MVLKKIFLWFSILFLCLLFSSCVDIYTFLQFKQDGSGSIEMRYKISRLVINIGSYALEKKRSIPLPIEKDDFDRSVELIEGLELVSYSQSENEEFRIIETKLNFDNPDALMIFFTSIGEQTLIISDDEKVSTLTHIIRPGTESPPDEETLLLARELFPDYAITYELVFPRTIKSYNVGMLGDSDNIITFTENFVDILSSREPLEWKITW